MEVQCDLQNDRDNAPVSAYDHFYHDLHRFPRTPVSTAALNAQNLQHVVQQIGAETGRILNRNVRVQPNAAFYNVVQGIVAAAPNYQNVQQAVALINAAIIKHEIPVQVRGLRRRELFFKWFFFKDRPRVIAPPANTHGRRRRTDVGAYRLQDPKNRYWQQFLQSRCAS